MKNNPENINTGADRRRENAERKDELSISHWRGELHSHTRTDISNPELPDDVIEYRKGSNCGQVPLEALLSYHNQEMKNEFIAITEHARDGNPEKAVKGMTEWFVGMYLSNEQWLKNNYLKNKEDLSTEDLEEIKKLAATKAEEVANYGDERIKEILNDIDNSAGEVGIKVFKGVETSLLPDGSLDTPMVERREFDLVNCSIHPNVNKQAFQDIIKDPDKYTDLLLSGASNKHVNILSHIEVGAGEGVLEKLRWEEIAESAIENQVAIEINLKKLITFIYNDILDYDKYPKDETSYRQVLEAKLDELIPLISSPIIKNRLKPFFKNGLKIAINTDEHANKFINSSTDKNETQFSFKVRDLRYWRALKIVEKYFNNSFNELGITNDNIINTYNKEELSKFLNKASK